MCAAERNETPTSCVARVVAVLNAFGVDDVALGVSELSRRTGLPKSTVARLVAGLTAHGLLMRTGDKVRLGLRLFELGQLVPVNRDLREAAAPFMADLHEATRQVVHLAVLEGTEVVYLDILRGKDSPALPSRVGGRLPAHATGVGKAILAFSPPEVVEKLVARGLTRLSPRTIVVPALLYRELERIREEGVAYDREESSLGVVCAASPIFNAEGSPVGALSISGWSSRMNLDRMAPAVRTAALALSRTLNAPLSRTPNALRHR